MCETLDRLDKWNMYSVMAMPDHIHILTAPVDRELSVAAFLKWFKRWFNESYWLAQEMEMAAGWL